MFTGNHFLMNLALSARHPESEVRRAPVHYPCWVVPNIDAPTAYLKNVLPHNLILTSRTQCDLRALSRISLIKKAP